MAIVFRVRGEIAKQVQISFSFSTILWVKDFIDIESRLTAVRGERLGGCEKGEEMKQRTNSDADDSMAITRVKGGTG